MTDTRPEPLCGKYRDTFAFVTIRDRLPEILTKVIDVFSRMASEHHKNNADDKADDAKNIVGKLSQLKNQMQTDKEMRALEDNYPDARIWNEFVASCPILDEKRKVPTWFSVPWLTCECYLYRRIFEALQMSDFHKDCDPFQEQKSKAFYSSQTAMATLARYVIQFAESDVASSETHEQLKGDFEMLLEYCLWGNKCDLSLSAGTQVTHQLKESSQLKNLLEHILVNDTDKIWEQITLAQSREGGSARLDFVLDNSGFELYTDLCLAEFLLDKKLFDVVNFHVKEMPWFVSDASEKDVVWTIEECAKSDDAVISKLGQRWAKRLSENSFVIVKQPYWTYPHDYAAMKATDSSLYNLLSESNLIIFKGDLNYRKLIGDRNWPHTTSFSEALHGFCPAPLCALRTLKADLVVGLAPGQAEKMTEKEEKWMVNGQYAVIQHCRKI